MSGQYIHSPSRREPVWTGDGRDSPDPTKPARARRSIGASSGYSEAVDAESGFESRRGSTRTTAVARASRTTASTSWTPSTTRFSPHRRPRPTSMPDGTDLATTNESRSRRRSSTKWSTFRTTSRRRTKTIHATRSRRSSTGVGDCEDVSILLAELLRTLGYDVVLLNPLEHIQVGIRRDSTYPGAYYEWNGSRYYVLEATGEQWAVGETPPEFIGLPVQVIPLSKTPVIVHRWSARATGERDIISQVTVTNLGDWRANDLTGDVEFRTSDGVIAGTRSGSIAELNAGRTHVFELSVQLSHPDPTRGKARVTLRGEAWDQSSSLVCIA